MRPRPMAVRRKESEPREYQHIYFELKIRLNSDTITPEQLEDIAVKLRSHARKAVYDAGLTARLVVVTPELGEVSPVPEIFPEQV